MRLPTRCALLAVVLLLGLLPSTGPVAAGPPTPTPGGGHLTLPACPGSPFTDVPADHPYCVDITWLVDQAIADGYPDGTFRPTAQVSRQALAAFLQRYLTGGSTPAPCTEPPFSDVPVDHPFCAEIAWIADQGFVLGFPVGEFRPTLPVSRQALAGILSRVAHQGSPPPACTADPFTDVDAGRPFCADIAWLAGTGVIGGYPDGSFRPAAPVTRQVLAALLHRYEDDVVGDGFVDAAWWRARQDDYLLHATGAPPGGSILALISHLERDARDPSYDFDATGIGPDAFASSWNKIDNYLDTADFDLLYLMNLWYGYADELGPELRDRIE